MKRIEQQGSSGRQESIAPGLTGKFEIFMTSVYSRLRLKKRTSINSISNFTRRRKWQIFANGLWRLLQRPFCSFWVARHTHKVPLLLFANATAGNPHIVRQEGVAELVGDLVLNCTGGSFTPAGTFIGPATNGGTNVQINLNTNVTSRLTGAGADSEAILAIDEPYPDSNGQTPFPPPPASAPVRRSRPLSTRLRRGRALGLPERPKPGMGLRGRRHLQWHAGPPQHLPGSREFLQPLPDQLAGRAD